ncbi:MAG TPA: hypothetical protein VLT82_05470 [Myxococcaceae bacterium]|nr:hypothetical protein [Myxococcaceae bacterium]
MLDSFVIDQVDRRDRWERDERERPAVELPLPAPEERERPVRRSDQDGREEKPKRGVVVIDLRRLH